MFFGIVIAFAGVAGGIYVGFALVDKSPTILGQTGSKAADTGESERWVDFDIGDLFPPDNHIELDGSVAEFEQLLKGRKTLLVFTSFGCDPCLRLLKTWARDITPRMLSDVQVVVCATSDRGNVPEEYRPLLENTKLVYYDERYYRDQYHMVVFPTVVGVDASGFIQHIQLGFNGAIDRDIVDYFTSFNR